MTSNPLTPWLQIGKGRSLDTGDFEALLDAFALPAILVDIKSRRVLTGNASFTQVSSYTRRELASLTVLDLFPGLSQDVFQITIKATTEPGAEGAEKSPELSHRATLQPKNKGKIPASLRIVPVGQDPKRMLLIAEPEYSQYPQSTALDLEAHWKSLLELVSAPHENDLQVAKSHALRAAQALSGDGILAIYTAKDQEPGLELSESLGPLEHLPRSLPAQELAQIRKPVLWKHDQRSTTSLQRAARAGGFSYLATAPIGSEQASIGLVVIADTTASPPGDILPIVQSLAHTFTTLFEQQAQVASYHDDLQSFALHAALIESVSDFVLEGLLVLNTDLQIMRMNKPAEELFGYPPEEVVNQPLEYVLIGNEDIQPMLQEITRTFQPSNPVYLRLFRRNGESFSAYVRATPVILEGRLERILLMVNDLTEQERMREHTQALEQRAILGEVTAIFAHEVRNPINNLMTGLDLLASNLPEDDPNQAVILRMREDCDRLEAQMKSVLSFSKPTDYALEKMDIGPLLHRLMEKQRARPNPAEIKFIESLEPDCPPILGNGRALEQVFTNLINNAVNAMNPRGGSLIIRTQPVQADEERISSFNSPTNQLECRTYVDITVTDTGPGIPEENQDRIFQPFFTTNPHGNGLGLAIARRIVVAHKGSISLKSFTSGTIFTVRIPAAS